MAAFHSTRQFILIAGKVGCEATREALAGFDFTGIAAAVDCTAPMPAVRGSTISRLKSTQSGPPIAEAHSSGMPALRSPAK
jgi:hypothetical protein